jgi:hypothetical protein
VVDILDQTDSTICCLVLELWKDVLHVYWRNEKVTVSVSQHRFQLYTGVWWTVNWKGSFTACRLYCPLQLSQNHLCSENYTCTPAVQLYKYSRNEPVGALNWVPLTLWARADTPVKLSNQHEIHIQSAPAVAGLLSRMWRWTDKHVKTWHVLMMYATFLLLFVYHSNTQ